MDGLMAWVAVKPLVRGVRAEGPSVEVMVDPS